MRPIFRLAAFFVAAAVLGVPATPTAQINFQKDKYYLSLGDSLAAGEGALPVTHGFVYELYDRGVFGQKQETDFSNIGMRGITADEILALQVPQALCIQPPRIGVAPTVITLTAGANDLFVYIAANGVPQDPATIVALADGIAAKVAAIVRALVFGLPGLPASCAGQGIQGVRVLVSNYYSFNHPDPTVAALLDFALRSFGTSLETRLALISGQLQASGKTARVGLVDTFSAMEGRTGLLLIERRNGFESPFNFEIHPTNAGHAVIAAEFEKVWKTLQ